MNLTEEEWRAQLSPEEYQVLRRHGTEQAWSGCFVGTHETGTYVCAGCELPLFRSGEKFESGTGWPSFWKPLDNAVVEESDVSMGMKRVEVLCRRCGGHLGHVFEDGPPPTGLRYCMNGLSMTFTPGTGGSS